MSADPYNARVREFFAAPAHAGDLADGVTVLADDQGVRVVLSASVVDGRIAALRFRAWGCPHLIAALEWVCRHYEGEAPEALEKFPTARIMVDLAVPIEKTGRILVIEDAIQSLGRSLNH
jgi:NifU-like protein